MRIQLKQYTEPIFSELATQRSTLAAHPFLVAANELSTPTLHEFAFHQYSDSILWIPMLAQMKSKATRSRRLRRAIEDNIAHEAGLGGTSHVTLAVAADAQPRHRRPRRLPDPRVRTLGDAVAVRRVRRHFSEPEIAGWLLAAETLVPEMFAAIEPAFARLGADTRYFSEHVAVDTDEHAAWMAEAVVEIVELYGPTCVPRSSARHGRRL